MAEAEASLPPPLRGKTSHVAYAGALNGNIERLLQDSSGHLHSTAVAVLVDTNLFDGSNDSLGKSIQIINATAK